ncbi:MAG: UUP1 family membrane protein [Planctomycetota bacterium]
MRSRDRLAVVAFAALAFALMFLKVRILGPSLAALLPEEHRELLVRVWLDGHGEDVRVRMALPIATDRQRVRDELVSSSEFRFHMERQGPNRWGVWEDEEVKGRRALVYAATVRSERRAYRLPPEIEIPPRYPEEAQAHLLPTEQVQSAAKEIRALFEEIVPAPERRNAAAIARAAFEYCRARIRPISIRGTTDALTCLRLGEGSCGGKSRLLAALLRAGGIPARLAGGVILKNASWTSSHVWVEAWLTGRWVPFCPLNGRFAEVPAEYLVLYYGDESLFAHSPDINFSYVFHSKTVLVPPASPEAPPPGPFNLWAAFEGVGIPVDLLKIILVLPFGALVVVVARNLVGVRTFGTFMPALMAVAFRDTGLGWGLLLLATVLASGLGVRMALERFQLLHTPRLAVILTAVVATIVGFALFAQATGYLLPTRVSLFPIVILTLTVERFSAMWEEDGPRATLLVTAGTMAVVAAAYSAVEARWVQTSVLAFPESLLLAVAAFFFAGRWTGLRILEYLRFAPLIGTEGRP